MLKIFCGEDQVASRQAFRVEVDKISANPGVEVISFNGKTLEISDLIQATQAQSFFGGDKVVCIEGLFSLPRSKAKNQLVEYLSEVKDKQDILVWEPKAVTPSIAKKFGSAAVTEFKLPKHLFQFLEQLDPHNLPRSFSLMQKCYPETASEMLLYMLVRQMRFLLVLSHGGSLKQPPWLLNKLKSQANRFETSQLEKAYMKLIEIEYLHKSGQSEMSLKDSLDKWLLQI